MKKKQFVRKNTSCWPFIKRFIPLTRKELHIIGQLSVKREKWLNNRTLFIYTHTQLTTNSNYPEDPYGGDAVLMPPLVYYSENPRAIKSKDKNIFSAVFHFSTSSWNTQVLILRTRDDTCWRYCWRCWLVRFYGISTFVGYLMPNPVYTYIRILNIYDL